MKFFFPEQLSDIPEERQFFTNMWSKCYVRLGSPFRFVVAKWAILIKIGSWGTNLTSHSTELKAHVHVTYCRPVRIVQMDDEDAPVTQYVCKMSATVSLSEVLSC